MVNTSLCRVMQTIADIFFLHVLFGTTNWCFLRVSEWPRANCRGFGKITNIPRHQLSIVLTMILFISLVYQRWKNVAACQQCWCKFFPCSGKIYAKFYAVLLQKWVFLFWIIFSVLIFFLYSWSESAEGLLSKRPTLYISFVFWFFLVFGFHKTSNSWD